MPRERLTNAGFAGWAKAEAKAGDRLPYARLLDAQMLAGGVVRLRDGAVMAAAQIAGLPAEAAEAGEINAAAAARALFLRSGLDARFVLYHHIIRRRVEVDHAGSFAAPFAAHLDVRWREQLGGGALFVNDQFITLVRRPARGKAGWGARIARRLNRRAGELMADPADLRALEAAMAQMLAALAPAGARRLGDYDGAGGACSEMLELLSALYNGEMRPVRRPVPGTDIGAMLPYVRASFGLDAMELRGPGGAHCTAMLGLKDYPASTAPGLLDPLLALPHEFILTESWAPADRQIAREAVDLAIRRQRTADEEGLAERAELYAARDALGVGEAAYGHHHLSLLVRAESLPGLDAAVAAAAGALADAGAVAVREDVNLEPAFWGQFPGNEAYLVRRALTSSANMADFAACHGAGMGEAHGNHWGEALTVIPTTSATPYFFNLHTADLGNFTLIGPSGSGKTVILNFLAAAAQRYAPRTVIFDKDRGAEIFVRAMGGRYTRLTPGEPTGFNPLALPDTPANRAFLRDFMAVLLAAGGPEEEAMIAAGIDAAYAGEPRLRRLAHFGELLSGHRRPQSGDLAHRLAPWLAGGPHGWLFDSGVREGSAGPSGDGLDLTAPMLGFDMTALLESPALRTPAMMYLFHRIEARLDGSPTLLLIDEGWKMLDDAAFQHRIRDWLKTLRKRNALVGFATQSARDALDSAIAPALVEQTATMLFTPNPRARAEDYCTDFGLTEHELALIRNLPVASRCFLAKQGGTAQVLRLDLGGMDDLITVLSGREATVRRLDLLRARHGDAPAGWYRALTGAEWPGQNDKAPDEDTPEGRAALFPWADAPAEPLVAEAAE